MSGLAGDNRDAEVHTVLRLGAARKSTQAAAALEIGRAVAWRGANGPGKRQAGLGKVGSVELVADCATMPGHEFVFGTIRGSRDVNFSSPFRE
jgi:hypothetical protein